MLDQEFLSSVPHSPGVYLMQDSKSAVLYVGKAKDLFKRISSYVHFAGPTHSKTFVMLKRVFKVDTIVTRTEKEALILEASLIKKHRPKYNVILRDDKTYPYIKVTLQEEWPRVFMSRRKKRDGARYYGPYSSSSSMWTTLKQLSTLFPLRRCKGPTLKPRKRPCLNHQLGNCLAPCAGNADHAQYMEMVNNVIMFLEGRNSSLLSSLKAEMVKASEALEFERAATLRDRINALNRTLEKQIIISKNTVNRDVFGFARQNLCVSIIVFFIRGGIIGGSRSFFLEDPYGDDPAILSQVIKQFYTIDNSPPTEVLLPFSVDDQELLSEHLGDIAGRKCTVSTPQKAEPKELVKMALANAEKVFDELEKKKQSWQALSDSIVSRLRLNSTPETIECLDISNISGTNSVGSLICFTAGNPDTKRYRHYKITTVEGPDDYGMMREVLYRRFSRGQEADDLPDLLLIDGGRGQLGVAEAVAAELGLTGSIELLGIAKEKEDEGEKLYKPGRKNPIILKPHNPVLLYLMRIRDESHRFGVTFHRSLRRKKTLSSQLDRIPGIGPNKRKQLLLELGSVKKISEATVEELQEVPGIGPELAGEIFRFFHQVDNG